MLELNKSPTFRIKQISLALERLRWISGINNQIPFVLINIPSFDLNIYDYSQKNTALISMRIITGKALQTPTPLFHSTLTYIEFNPFWNIPQSIIKKEIIPLLRKNPYYLEKRDMEIVGNNIEIDEETLDNLQHGDLRIRQRPGNKNALGKIKFILPNNMDIYLHATPTPQLFKKERRDFSHGCIRVEHPEALAQFLLRNRPEWSLEKIQAAIADKKTKKIRLFDPVPIIIFYTTTLVNNDGQPIFLPDIYEKDQKLNDELLEIETHSF